MHHSKMWDVQSNGIFSCPLFLNLISLSPLKFSFPFSLPFSPFIFLPPLSGSDLFISLLEPKIPPGPHPQETCALALMCRSNSEMPSRIIMIWSILHTISAMLSPATLPHMTLNCRTQTMKSRRDVPPPGNQSSSIFHDFLHDLCMIWLSMLQFPGPPVREAN